VRRLERGEMTAIEAIDATLTEELMPRLQPSLGKNRIVAHAER
jgi:hypothetical protein